MTVTVKAAGTGEAERDHTGAAGVTAGAVAGVKAEAKAPVGAAAGAAAGAGKEARTGPARRGAKSVETVKTVTRGGGT